MGSMMSNAMNENAKKMQKMQKEMMLKQRQTQLAMQFASGKELFTWYATFYAVIFPFCLIGAFHKKNPAPIIPLVPLGFILGYQYDMFYGTKMQRIKKEAERLLAEEQDRFRFPKGAGIASEEEYDEILGIKKKQ